MIAGMSSNRLADLEVEVRVDGQWWPGWLDPDDWRHVDGRWAALVRWSMGAAENRLKTFDQDDIRQVQS
jgi:hypothetical protein